jgi:hypothetical protein
MNGGYDQSTIYACMEISQWTNKYGLMIIIKCTVLKSWKNMTSVIRE